MKWLRLLAVYGLGIWLPQTVYGVSSGGISGDEREVTEHLKTGGGGASSGALQDPFTWVYTSAFAKRYGMPEQWVDDRLAGADAVAFRVEPQSSVTCGFFRDPSACSQDLKCRFDLYIPKSANLPWNDDRPQGFKVRDNKHSVRFLIPQAIEEWGNYDSERDMINPRKSKVGLMLVDYTLNSNFDDFDEKYGDGGFWVKEFDRELIKDTDFISVNTLCSSLPTEKKGVPAITFYDVGDDYFKDREVVYRAQIPRGFMDRVNGVSARDRKGKTTLDFVKKRFSGDQ